MVTLAPVQVLSTHTWLVATPVDIAKMGRFHHHGTLSWTVLAGWALENLVRDLQWCVGLRWGTTSTTCCFKFGFFWSLSAARRAGQMVEAL